MCHALIFTFSFVAYKLPSGLYEYAYRFPPEFLQESTLTAIRGWREVHVSIDLIGTILSPLLILIVSTDLWLHTNAHSADLALVNIYD